MMQIKCEMCGSSDLVKEDSLYVCKHCGMKYSPEEAKKMMVEIEGAVKIDDSEYLANLYVLARRARDSENVLDARKYYSQILIKDPINWEPAFYSLILQSIDCKIAQLAEACDRITSGISSVIGLVKDNVPDKEEQKRIFNEMASKINWITGVFFGNAQTSLNSEYSKEKRKATFVSAINAAYRFADELNTAFPNGEFIDAEILSTKQAILMHSILSKEFTPSAEERNIYVVKTQYIKKYDPSYDVPSFPGVTSQQIEAGLTSEEINKEHEKKSKKSSFVGCLIALAFLILAILFATWVFGSIFSGIGNFFGL